MAQITVPMASPKASRSAVARDSATAACETMRKLGPGDIVPMSCTSAIVAIASVRSDIGGSSEAGLRGYAGSSSPSRSKARFTAGRSPIRRACAVQFGKSLAMSKPSVGPRPQVQNTRR
jgi:hypothetical protein